MAAVRQPMAQKLLARAKTCKKPRERGTYLEPLIALGCTVRGLADELGVSEGAIRYQVRVAGIPVASATHQTVSEQRRRRKPRRRQPPLPPIERAGRRIANWLRAELLRLTEGDCELLFHEAVEVARSLDRQPQMRKGLPGSRLPWRKVIELCRPAKAEAMFWMAMYSQWLGTWIWALYSDGVLREDALDRARKLYFVPPTELRHSR